MQFENFSNTANKQDCQAISQSAADAYMPNLPHFDSSENNQQINLDSLLPDFTIDQSPDNNVGIDKGMGSDLGVDTGTNAGIGAGTGAGTDTGAGAGTDTGAGAGTDAGTGAGADTGIDTGSGSDSGTGFDANPGMEGDGTTDTPTASGGGDQASVTDDASNLASKDVGDAGNVGAVPYEFRGDSKLQDAVSQANKGAYTDSTIQKLSTSDPALANTLQIAHGLVDNGAMSKEGFKQFEKNIATNLRLNSEDNKSQSRLGTAHAVIEDSAEKLTNRDFMSVFKAEESALTAAGDHKLWGEPVSNFQAPTSDSTSYDAGYAAMNEFGF